MNEAAMIVDEIFAVFERFGSASYFGEPVSQLEHALQAAFLAEQACAPGPLKGAALLHDLGHLLHERPEDVAEHGEDAQHEEIGALWLAQYFEESVTEPIRLHVAAKRYLCAVDAGYRKRLSQASILSLDLQGGPMSSSEARAFEVTPYSSESLLLRQWDEEAKDASLKTPPLAQYRGLLTTLASLKN